MFRNDEQRQLLNKAVSAAQESLSLSLGHAIRVRVAEGTTGDTVTIAVRPDRLRFEPIVSVTMSPAFVLSTTRHRYPRLLVTSRLTPTVVDVCRRFDIACIDTDGNVFLRWHESVVDIAGRRVSASRTFTEKGASSLIIGRSGLQLLFVLLSFPELVDATVRQLAAAAGISSASVSTILRELEKADQLRRVRDGRRLHHRAVLVDTFVDGYLRRLFDRLTLGTFSSDDRWWQNERAIVGAAGGQWGGESASWQTRRLRPQRGVVYLDSLDARLLRELRMRRDSTQTANAEFRRRFWHVDSAAESADVPPLLVYADLVANGDPRLLEAAASLRDASPELFGR